MSQADFVILYVVSLATMLASRCIPLFVLRARELPEQVTRALGLIPAAAFAALVANDLLEPSVLVGTPVVGALTLVAAAIVIVVARKTGSLIVCAVVGLVSFALLVLPFLPPA